MDKLIRSLHHVTATVNDAQQDLDFYVKLLGLRLVKKTVNFDNHNVYHFYYGNEHGTPSTIMTTFPYKGKVVTITSWISWLNGLSGPAGPIAFNRAHSTWRSSVLVTRKDSSWRRPRFAPAGHWS